MNYVYGGSFNPPTLAHQKIILKLKEIDPLSHVILLPVGDDYRKTYLAPFKHRYQMLKLLTKNMTNVSISTLEKEHKYQGTLKSLNDLNESYKDLCFVMGSDQIKDLKSWINVETLLASYPFVILQRDKNLDIKAIENEFMAYKHQFIWIPFDEDISSTQARLNKEIRKNILSKDIIQYMNKHHLYEETSLCINTDL